jgi:putative colanic acid biosynthesis UDP-glucose lipid carrier transferase
LLAIVFFQFSGSALGIYLSWRSQSLAALVQRLLLTVFVTFALLAIAAWASRQPHFVSRRMLLVFWFGFVCLFGVLFRWAVRHLLISLRKRGYNSKQAVIYGAGSLGESLLEKLNSNIWMGIRVEGIYDDVAPENKDIEIAGGFDQVVELARSGSVDSVYIALPMSRNEQISNLIDALMDTTVAIYLIPDVFAFSLLNARQENIGGMPAINLVGNPLTVVESLVKRCFDIVVASCILVLIALPMVLIAVAIKLTSSGPVIFKQLRYGVDGKPISVWKFRSMYTQDNGDYIQQAQKNDPRVTSLGAFLRRSSLDELPQFINVLQGRMSIVGPRPHAIAHNEFYRSRIKGYMMRHKMKPGITGWAQVNGFRGETDTIEKMEKRVEYDLYYLSNWSLWLDIKIIALTVVGGFFGKNVY